MKTTSLKATANETTRAGKRTHKPLKPRPTSMKLKRILVPLDFSEHAEQALHYAVRFAEPFGARIDLVSVVEPFMCADGMTLPAGTGDLDKTLRKLAEREIPDGLKWKALVRQGSAYAQIVETARDQQTDLLIITTHGRTGLTHFLIGSTAEKIVRHAPCPVLVLKPGKP